MWPSWSHKLKCDSFEKTTWCQSACQALCSLVHCRRSRRWCAVRRILYKGSFARHPQCSRRQRIDEADISTPVAVDQWAAWRKLWGDSPPCGAGADRGALTSPSVDHCQLFGARRSTASKLASLWNDSTAHELLLRDRKILLIEGR
ncbi:uncharacterized protein TNCV_3768981 [Trichonephila clavipes]|nr:uncharacterized protein TNCV_3768981 [Trichonephila clavipes]